MISEVLPKIWEVSVFNLIQEGAVLLIAIGTLGSGKCISMLVALQAGVQHLQEHRQIHQQHQAPQQILQLLKLPPYQGHPLIHELHLKHLQEHQQILQHHLEQLPPQRVQLPQEATAHQLVQHDQLAVRLPIHLLLLNPLVYLEQVQVHKLQHTPTQELLPTHPLCRILILPQEPLQIQCLVLPQAL